MLLFQLTPRAHQNTSLHSTVNNKKRELIIQNIIIHIITGYIVETTLRQEFDGIIEQSGIPLAINSLTITPPTGGEGDPTSAYTATLSITEPQPGTLLAIINAGLSQPATLSVLQLCHLKSYQLSGTDPVPVTTLQCATFPVLYTIELTVSELPESVDPSVLVAFIQNSTAQIYGLTGYTTAFHSVSSEKTPVAAASAETYTLSFVVSEQQPGLFGNLSCMSFNQSAGQITDLTDPTCFIKAISSNVSGEHHCKDIKVCPVASATLTFRFAKAVSQQAISYELATMMEALGKYAGDVSLAGIVFAEDRKSATVTLTGVSNALIANFIPMLSQFM